MNAKDKQLRGEDRNRLRDALEWYADDDNWYMTGAGQSVLKTSESPETVARRALADIDEALPNG